MPSFLFLKFTRLLESLLRIIPVSSAYREETANCASEGRVRPHKDLPAGHANGTRESTQSPLVHLVSSVLSLKASQSNGRCVLVPAISGRHRPYRYRRARVRVRSSPIP